MFELRTLKSEYAGPFSIILTAPSLCKKSRGTNVENGARILISILFSEIFHGRARLFNRRYKFEIWKFCVEPLWYYEGFQNSENGAVAPGPAGLVRNF